MKASLQKTMSFQRLCPIICADFRDFAPAPLVRIFLMPAISKVDFASQPCCQRFTGWNGRSLVGYPPKETLRCRGVTSTVFSDACSESINQSGAKPTVTPRTQSSKGLPLQSGVSQYTAMHATLTASNSILISTFPVHSPSFPPKKPSPGVFLC